MGQLLRNVKDNCGEPIILCEGQDEMALIKRLSERNHIGKCTCVDRAIGGSLAQELNNIAAQAEANALSVRVALLFDAERSRQQIVSRLRRDAQAAGLKFPAREGTGKTTKFKGGGSVKVAFLVLPKGRASGKLEDIFLDEIQRGPFFDCLEEGLDCIEKKIGKLKDRKKTMLRWHIAVGSPYNTNIYCGLQHGSLALSGPGVDSIVRMINKL